MHAICRKFIWAFVIFGALCSCGTFSDCDYAFPPIKQFDVDSIKLAINSSYEFEQYDSILNFSSRNELLLTANNSINVMPNLDTKNMTLTIESFEYIPQRNFIPSVDPGPGECKHYVEYRGYYFGESFLDSGFSVVFTRADSVKRNWDIRIAADTTRLPKINFDTSNRAVVIKSIFKHSDSAEYSLYRWHDWSVIDKRSAKIDSDSCAFSVDSLLIKRFVQKSPFYPRPMHPYSFCVESNQNVVSWNVNNINNNGRFRLCRKIEGPALALLLHWDSALTKPAD